MSPIDPPKRAEARTAPRSAGRARALTAAMLVAVTLSVGCGGGVQRKLFIRSTPPGAAVYVDDQRVGFTPAYVDYRYYGSRKIQLIKDGFESVTVYQRLDAPWYQYPVIDFFSENFSPYEIRDERVIDFTLEPQKIVSQEAILQSAGSLREQVRQGTVVPLPPLGSVPLQGAPAAFAPGSQTAPTP